MIPNPLLIALILSATFLVLFAIERFAPLRAPRGELARRLLVNLCVSAIAIGTAYFVVAPAAKASLQYVAIERVGLLRWVELPAALELMIGFALVDLSFYYWHVANHKIPFLWRFHNVHHIDPDLDVSTAFRFHFGEVVLSAGLRVLQIVLLGISPLTFATYEIVFQINTLVQHSNIRQPRAVEPLLYTGRSTPPMAGGPDASAGRGGQPSFSRALLAPPINRATSAGRMKRASCWTRCSQSSMPT